MLKSNLVGYASNEEGIRHAGVIEKEAKREDALYMLVSCLVFVNYIIDKLKIVLEMENKNG